MVIVKVVFLGGRLVLIVMVMIYLYWSGSLGLQFYLLECFNDIIYGLMSFICFGMDGMVMIGMQVSSLLYCLLVQVMLE